MITSKEQENKEGKQKLQEPWLSGNGARRQRKTLTSEDFHQI